MDADAAGRSAPSSGPRPGGGSAPSAAGAPIVEALAERAGQVDLDALLLELTEAGARVADIADVLGVTRSTVYVMIERAREQ